MAHPIETLQPHGSGDFLSENFQEYEIGKVKKVNTDRSHAGVTFYQEKYTITWEGYDGEERSNSYIVTSSDIPKQLQRDGSDIASVETSAFLTKFGGINKRRQLALAQDFYLPSTFIGVEQDLGKFGHIEENAHNHLYIAAHIAERFGRDKANVILNGISRGAMHGLSTHSIASEHGINVIYSDNIVPCFPNGLNPYTDLKDFLKFLPNEANSVRALKLPLRILRHYPKTLDGSARGLFQQLKDAPTLLAGRMGELMDSRMDQDSFAYISAFGGDIMSQGNRWLERFGSDFPNVTVNLNPEGAHMSCVSDECYSAWHDRMTTISELLHENKHVIHLGATAVHDLAASMNPVFAKSSQSAYSLAA